MSHDLQLKNVIEIIYLITLNRRPLDQEIELYFAAYSNGESLESLLFGITNSEEAKQILVERVVDTISKSDLNSDASDRLVEVLGNYLIPNNVGLRAALEALYSVALDRYPNDEELYPYFDAYLNGTTLEQLFSSISNSQEAKLRLNTQALDILATKDLADIRCARAVEVSADDLMNAIARSYEKFIGRQPLFSEIAKRFRDIVNGASLTGEIVSIAESDEAAANSSNRQIPDSRETFAEYIACIYKYCLQRNISEDEITIWYNHYNFGLSYREILSSVHNCDEAVEKRKNDVLAEFEPGVFIQLLCEIVLGHGAAPSDIASRSHAIEDGSISRQELLNSFFAHACRIATTCADAPTYNGHPSAYIFGRSEPLTIDQWRNRAQALDAGAQPIVPKFARFAFKSNRKPLVSIITSLFKGGKFIENFLENITNQTIFEKYCELLIIDANSPENEFEKAQKFLRRFDNIKYHRCSYQIGIYDAWNLGISQSSGLYCTNANLDDCRRDDSLEIQAATLDALNFVDIVYQDIFYSFTENMTFSDIQKFGFKTDLPIISRYNLLEFNSPHNAPMWRKRLHEEVGLFNGAYRSAGDAEFWTRCLLAGKTFYKINDPHVAYYNNPEGLSTRSDTPGVAESNLITKTFNRSLISSDITMPEGRFLEKVSSMVGGPVEGPDRYAIVQDALRKFSATTRTT